MLSAALALFVLLLAGCASGDVPAAHPPVILPADLCAVPPLVQGHLIREYVLPRLTTPQRRTAIYVDDCPTGVDTAWTWTTGTYDPADSLGAFLSAGWRHTTADLVGGWAYAVLGQIAGNTFRVDLQCDPNRTNPPVLKYEGPGCFAEARLVRLSPTPTPSSSPNG